MSYVQMTLDMHKHVNKTHSYIYNIFLCTGLHHYTCTKSSPAIIDGDIEA